MQRELKGICRAAVIFASLGALAAFGSAQRFNRRINAFNTTMDGRGTVHFHGASYGFGRLQLTLQGNRRVTVHALMDGRVNDIVLTGRADDRSVRSGRMNFSIDNFATGRDMDSADATGYADMSGPRTFSSVHVSGRNATDRTGISLDFASNGRVVTEYQDTDSNRRYNDYGDRRNPDRNRYGDRGREAAGRYVDVERWRDRGDEFTMQYRLDLARMSGQARLVVSGDRYMPNDNRNRDSHGDILKYLQSGQDVIETGRWTQNGDSITIRFDTIEYGRTIRSKDEKWVGHLRGNTLIIDSFEKSFYGHDVRLALDRS